MGNLWSDEFGPDKTSQKEPDKLELNHVDAPWSQKIILWNTFFQCLFMSLATLKVFKVFKSFPKFGAYF